LPSLSRSIARYTLAATLLSLLGSVSAQVGIPYVPPEFHQDVRRIQGDKIVVCTWPLVSPTAALDRAVAEALSAVLLIDVEIVEHRSETDLSSDEFFEDVYVQLGATCDALAGVILQADAFPEWLMPTRPYVVAPYALLVPGDSSYESLGDVPANAIIGSQVLTEGDWQLLGYITSLPEDRRWRRFPYQSAEMMANHLANGVIQAGLIWQPSWAAVAQAPEVAALGLRTVSIAPMPAVASGVGFAVRSNNTFLRNALDVALEAMEAEGLLAELAAAHGIAHVSP